MRARRWGGIIGLFVGGFLAAGHVGWWLLFWPGGFLLGRFLGRIVALFAYSSLSADPEFQQFQENMRWVEAEQARRANATSYRVRNGRDLDES